MGLSATCGLEGFFGGMRTLVYCCDDREAGGCEQGGEMYYERPVIRSLPDFVILSEAESSRRELPASPSRRSHPGPVLVVLNVVQRTPCSVRDAANYKGSFDYANCSASRSSRSAQDDSLEGSVSLLCLRDNSHALAYFHET